VNAPAPALRGLVIRYRLYEGWGLLKPIDARLDDHSTDIFFHRSCVHGRPLREGEEVLYTLGVAEDGRLRATEVMRKV
jgi:cold shock CspA family protein